MIADYLIAFFSELDKLQPSGNHAVTLHHGALYVLVGMGDVRVRVGVDALDPNPATAAEDVFKYWRSMTETETNLTIEEIR